MTQRKGVRHDIRNSPQAAMRSAPAPGQSRRVLIVEDELLVAWHLETLAREQNLDVCALVPDGDGAIEQADDLDVDLILMDIRLAGRMDGIEAARRIRERAQPRSSSSPLTATRNPRHIDADRARRAGAGQADHDRAPARAIVTAIKPAV